MVFHNNNSDNDTLMTLYSLKTSQNGRKRRRTLVDVDAGPLQQLDQLLCRAGHQASLQQQKQVNTESATTETSVCNNRNNSLQQQKQYQQHRVCNNKNNSQQQQKQQSATTGTKISSSSCSLLPPGCCSDVC